MIRREVFNHATAIPLAASAVAVTTAGPLATALAVSDHPDAAALISLKAEFDREHGKLAPLVVEQVRLETIFNDPRFKATGPEDGYVTRRVWAEWCAMRSQCGFEDAVRALNDQTSVNDGVAQKIIDTPAKTVVGLA